MIRDWTKHLKTEEDQKKFEASLRSSRFVLERLQEILNEQLALIEAAEVRVEDYDNASWANKQAHRNGQRSTLKTILRLINLDNRSSKNG